MHSCGASSKSLTGSATSLGRARAGAVGEGLGLDGASSVVALTGGAEVAGGGVVVGVVGAERPGQEQDEGEAADDGADADEDPARQRAALLLLGLLLVLELAVRPLPLTLLGSHERRRLRRVRRDSSAVVARRSGLEHAGDDAPCRARRRTTARRGWRGARRRRRSGGARPAARRRGRRRPAPRRRRTARRCRRAPAAPAASRSASGSKPSGRRAGREEAGPAVLDLAPTSGPATVRCRPPAAGRRRRPARRRGARRSISAVAARAAQVRRPHRRRAAPSDGRRQRIGQLGGALRGPSSLSGGSAWPCQRRARFHVDSPWRTQSRWTRHRHPSGTRRPVAGASAGVGCWVRSRRGDRAHVRVGPGGRRHRARRAARRRPSARCSAPPAQRYGDRLRRRAGDVPDLGQRRPGRRRRPRSARPTRWPSCRPCPAGDVSERATSAMSSGRAAGAPTRAAGARRRHLLRAPRRPGPRRPRPGRAGPPARRATPPRARPTSCATSSATACSATSDRPPRPAEDFSDHPRAGRARPALRRPRLRPPRRARRRRAGRRSPPPSTPSRPSVSAERRQVFAELDDLTDELVRRYRDEHRPTSATRHR